MVTEDFDILQPALGLDRASVGLSIGHVQQVASGLIRGNSQTDFEAKIKAERNKADKSKIDITVFAFEVSRSSRPNLLDVHAAFSTATIVNANNQTT